MRSTRFEISLYWKEEVEHLIVENLFLPDELLFDSQRLSQLPVFLLKIVEES